MFLDISPADCRALYSLKKKIAYSQGQLDNMADQYTDTCPEAEAISDVSVALSVADYKLDQILMPE